ncbi:MAG: PfkB family carbohydrate kinase [Sphingobacterium sp.]|uniref:sugar kinase n=1 Tax=Sphingobacterium sp. JB170 TaxID=1434842 RepID=UPI00097F3332|nr:sugar kinase [Sphingobacterium sp. JB170]SJN23356.1 2-dehydro-3-deoxygluconate kinase [Sphingobacterium sp. JB170]
MGEGKILNFGEILLRISPDTSSSWVESGLLPFHVGGAELNVATALACWGLPSAYSSAMPDNTICRDIATHLQSKGIDVSRMHWSGERLGIYYLPKGKDVKNAGVVYDRAGSSFASLSLEQIDWDALFFQVEWFHFSAICPAINQQAADICLAALKQAKARNVKISLDLNYRAKLWKYGKTPLEVMPALAEYCDLIMGNIWAAELMLGTSLEEPLRTVEQEYPRQLLLEQAERTSIELQQRFKNCKYVANTFRFDYRQTGIKYFTTLTVQDRFLVSNEYLSESIVDKVGSGDCFMAGLIYGFHQGMQANYTLEFATAAAYDKLFIASDATSSSVSEIEKRIQND